MTTADLPADIVPMTLEDLPEVIQIERVSFPMPFSLELFQMELRLDIAHLFTAKVREGGPPALAGYVDFWHVGPEIHLINIATAPEWRRRGIARRMMEFVVHYARRYRTREVVLDVRRSNEPALELYRFFGFTEVGVRKRYYQDNGEDALILLLKLP